MIKKKKLGNQNVKWIVVAVNYVNLFYTIWFERAKYVGIYIHWSTVI